MKCRLKILILVAALFIVNQLHGQGQVKLYHTDSITFSGERTGISYGGDITLPVSKNKLPAVIIMSGTGKQDRDGNMAGHRVFEEIGNYLGERGIIVLRMDDRGVGKTTGVYEDATTGDFAEDALVALRYLKTRKEVDAGAIGLMGHSEGGVSISIAASKNKEVAFLVSISGLCMSGYSAQVKQNEDIVNQSNLPDYDKKRSNQINQLMFTTALKFAKSADMEKELTKSYELWKKQDSIYFRSLNVKFDHFRFPVHRWIPMATGKWYRYFIQYDPAKTLRKVDIPILALNGDRDLLVACDENLKNWRTFPASGKKGKVKAVILKNVNHLLLPCQLCTPAEYNTIKSGISIEALATIAEWINKIKT